MKIYRNRNFWKLFCEMRITKYDHFMLDRSTQNGTHLCRRNILTDVLAMSQQQIWKLFEEEKKASRTLDMFKSKIKR